MNYLRRTSLSLLLTCLVSSSSISQYSPDSGPDIKFLKIPKPDRSIDWTMAIDDKDGRYNPELDDILHNGRSYLKVPVPEQFRINQERYLKGLDGAVGLIYTVPSNPVHKIDGFVIKRKGFSKDPDEPHLYDVEEILLQTGGHNLEIGYVIDRDNDGKYMWRKGNNIISLSAKDEVPEGYRPVSSLRILNLENYLEENDVSPNFNAHGISQLNQINNNYMLLYGMITTYGKTTFQVLNLIRKSHLQGLKRAKATFWGDGGYYLKEDPKGNLMGWFNNHGSYHLVLPLDSQSWNFRKERLVPNHFAE